jgi:signal peptidase I
MSVLIFLIVFYLLTSFTLQKVFEKAGVEGKKALIPGVAASNWSNIIGKSQKSTWWLLFPIVNFFTYSGMAIDMVRSFGLHGFWDSVLAVVATPLQFWRIGNQDKYKYEGAILPKETEWRTQLEDATKRKDKIGTDKLMRDSRFAKNGMRDWAEAMIFAVFAAAFIRMFLIEAYQIPTGSMEGSLKVGDFLFVSKAHYGIRTPRTVLQLPLIYNHGSMGEKGLSGLFNRETYLKEPSLTSVRLPAFEGIDRNEAVVFNWPEGDSIYLTPERSWSIYDTRTMLGGGEIMRKNKLIVRPIDKIDHYIKRCLAIAGDSLQIRDGQVYVNGTAAVNPKEMQFVYTSDKMLNVKKLESLGIAHGFIRDKDNKVVGMHMSLSEKMLAEVKTIDPSATIARYNFPAEGRMWPRAAVSANWTVDNFGPIWVPKAGATTPLSIENLPFYERAIRVYEGNKLEVTQDGKILINGQAATSYTFKYNYYWMQGDNRHNSEDARFWGYVPETHIVGKPLFVWFSTKDANIKNGIYWDRIGRSAQKMD